MLLLAGALLALTTLAPEPASAACRQACYDAKSTSYQRCRAVPPANRPARVACFQRADGALERCLKSCR